MAATKYTDDNPAMLTVFHSVERGAAYLTMLRGEYDQAQKTKGRRR